MVVGEPVSEAVRGALWLGVVPWDGRRQALGGSEDRGEDGLVAEGVSGFKALRVVAVWPR